MSSGTVSTSRQEKVLLAGGKCERLKENKVEERMPQKDSFNPFYFWQ